MLKITHVQDRNLTESRIYPKAEFIRKPNLSESRIYPKAEFYRMQNCFVVPKCGLNTRHDNREVTLTHLTWGKFCALTNRPPAQSTRTGQ